jgi:hypothetical protein
VLALTVVPGGEYSYFVVFDLIDEAMVLVDAPGQHPESWCLSLSIYGTSMCNSV